MPDRRSSLLYLHSLPAGTLLGVDLTSFHTTPTFHGLHALPPGLHHLFLSPPSSEIRHSQWVLVPPSTTLHFAFDTTSNHLHPCEPREVKEGGTTAYRQRSRIDGAEVNGELDGGDGVDAEWRKIIRNVTPRTLDRVFGGGEWCCSGLSGSRAVEEMEELGVGGETAGGDPEEQEELLFTKIDLKRTWREGAVGRERTEMARDRSWRLKEVAEAAGGKMEVLSEWEVAFVEAVLVGSYVAAMQWRRIVEMVLTSKSAAGTTEWEEMLLGFLEELREMCEVVKAGYVGDGSFLDIGEEVERWLRRFGRGLREIEDEGGVVGRRLSMEWGKTRKWAEQEMDWVLDSRDIVRRGMIMTEEGDMVEVEDEGVDEEEERGEYAPVVVELSEDQMDLDPAPDMTLSDAPDPFEEGDPRF